MHLLIIDDDEDLVFLAKTFLGRRGFKVKTALSGEEGLELMKTSDPFDCVILDYRFKKTDLQGEDILKLVKEKHKEVPVIISSGFTASYFRKKMPPEVFELVAGFVGKNFVDVEFVDSIKEVVEEKKRR